jgi:hypothetical protein
LGTPICAHLRCFGLAVRAKGYINQLAAVSVPENQPFVSWQNVASLGTWLNPLESFRLKLDTSTPDFKAGGTFASSSTLLTFSIRVIRG